MTCIKHKQHFTLGGSKFTIIDMLEDGYKVPESERMIAIKESPCITSNPKPRKKIELELNDKQRVYALNGAAWFVVVVDESISTSDCVRFVKV